MTYSNRPRKSPRFNDKPKSGTENELLGSLHGLEGQSYGAYKRVLGEWDFGSFTVYLDRIQSDPYAPPSAARVKMTTAQAGMPPQVLATRDQRVAAADFIVRHFDRAVRADSRFRAVSVALPGQTILERSSATVTETDIELRIQIRMPARGRSIMGHQAARIFEKELPDAVGEALDFRSAHAAEYLEELVHHVRTYEDHRALQDHLAANNWVAFVADGSMLARSSGISQLPLRDGVPFTSPDSLRQEVTLPHAGVVSGMAVGTGITLIVGGGYHGKSTLLSAIERGVYAHVPGDGRELVASQPSAMKIRAADGRPVTNVDVSPFINHLPTGSDTQHFSTQNASGSTSQASSLIEALEAGAQTILIDEDTSATNLMIRDERMRELVSGEQEPITPLVDRIRGLADTDEVSVLMVMGGSGAYLDVADRVLQMESYRCVDVTEKAKQVAIANPRPLTDLPGFPTLLPRSPRRLRLAERSKTKSSGLDQIQLDKQTINVADVEQIVDPGQTEAIAWALRGILFTLADQHKTLRELAAEVEARIDDQGLDALSRFGARRYPAFLVRPRAVDVIAAANRFRLLEVV